MLNQVSVQENVTHKDLWDFEIEIKLIILAIKPEQLLIYTKK